MKTKTIKFNRTSKHKKATRRTVKLTLKGLVAVAVSLYIIYLIFQFVLIGQRFF